MDADKKYSVLRWIVISAVATVLIVNVLGQIAPGYIDIVSVPTAPGNPSSTCLAGQPCNRLYVLGATGGTGATGQFLCKTTTGASCAIGATGPTGATGSGGGGSLAKICQTVLASPAASFTCSSIPGTYTNLIVEISGRSATSATTDEPIMSYNSDTTAAHYVSQQIIFSPSFNGFTSSTTSGVGLSNISGATAVASAASTIVADIAGYSGTTFLKSMVTKYASMARSTTFATASTESGEYSGTWNSTSAITAISVNLLSGANFATGSIFTVYGVQ